MENCFADEMAGVAAVGRLDKSLADHARALRVMIQEEAQSHFPDTHLIAVLRDAACLGFEHVESVKKRLDDLRPAGDLAALRAENTKLRAELAQRGQGRDDKRCLCPIPEVKGHELKCLLFEKGAGA